MSSSPPRRRIAWFSPLPPQRTGIADNVVPVLAALSEQHDVTLWTNEPNAKLETLGLPLVRYALPAIEAPGWDDPRQWSVDWRALNQSDAIIYHIGNNATFHADLWRIAVEQPGIVVLHDEALLHLTTAILPGRCAPDGRERYLRAMGRAHGRAGAEAGRAILLDYSKIVAYSSDFPLTSLATERARGVVVHSPDFAKRLAERYHGPLAYIPLPFPASMPPPAAMEPTRATPTSPGARVTVVMMGHIGPNRCLPQVLEALSDPRLAAFDLKIFGDVHEAEAVRGQIDALGLEGRVRLYGYLPEAELRRRLRSADLAVNLRNPTMGEASASQLSLWDAGLPVVTTRIGWYATLPTDATAFVDPGNEIEGVRHHLLAFAQDAAPYLAMGRAGRRHLEEEHTPAIYAQGLIDLMAACAAERTGRTAIPWMMERVAAATPFLGRSQAELFRGSAGAVADLAGNSARPWGEA